MTAVRPLAPCPAVALIPGAGCTEAPPAVLDHAPSDRIIPFADGQALFGEANEPEAFVTFDGSHGIDPAVGADLVGRLTQIYGP